jgi:diacylglycerol kinase (ATP)
MTAKVILNPYSNRWNSQKRRPAVEAALRNAGVDFDLAASESKGQIVDLVENAVREKYSPIIIAGGDGSLGDAVNGLAKAAASETELLGPFGIIPTGSANDVAFALGLPTDLDQAAQVIARGKTRPMDLGTLNGRYFINNSGGGLEPYVTTKHEKIRAIKGIIRYLVAAVQAILDKPEWRGKIKWDDGEYNGPLSLVSVGNGRRTGGFFMTPHADPFDGKLTLAYGYRGTRRGMFQALPRAFNEGKGSYLELEGMYEVQTTRVSIQLEQPSPAHTDGELLPQWIREFEYHIHPKRLNVIIP